ncbi:MAG: two-component regulator propeller domain-containing protein [Bacteroidia bacterium]|nr:two-component regulator propeller domain-containing protein [Bacteroidia bacterium]
MNKFKIIFLSILLLSSIFDSFAQNYNFRNFTVEDGLAQSQILSMCQDKNGNIWFGTNRGGISIYDGNKFTTFNENDSLINNVVYSITELNNGTLLFGTNGGLSMLSGKNITNFTDKNGLPHNRVFKTIQDKNGTVWIGTAKGLCQLSGNKIIPFIEDTLLNKANIFTMYSDKGNNIWFGTMEYGLIKYNLKTKKINYFNASNGLNDNFIWTINEDLQGNIYVGTNPGISRISPLGIIEKINIKGAENIGFRNIIADHENNLWFATPKGVYKYDHHTYKFYNEKNGLSGNSVYCALEDREGNMWFGIHGIGVSKFSGEAFTSYSTKDSLPGDYITSLFQDSKKNMWMGVKGFGVCKMKSNKITNYKLDPKNLENSIVDNEIQAICEDNNGNMYFGGLYKGMSIFNGTSFQNFDDSDGLPGSNIFAITKDHNGTIWIGTEKGLCFLKDGKIEIIEAIKKIKTESGSLPIYSIFEDSNRNLWLATENGVLKYDRKSVVKYSKLNGFTDNRVISIVQDTKGNIWFGTNDGVFRYDNSDFKKIDQNNGLASNVVYFIEFDMANNLWVATTKGIDRINLSIYNSSNKIEIRHFDKDDGLKGMEYNGNAKFKDSDGNLWFGTIKGVTVYNPHFAKVNRKEALTRITGIRLFFENAEKELSQYSSGLDSLAFLPKNLVLPYTKNHITFDFIGVCITDPNKVKYQFKLEGIDNDWFPPSSKTEATYSSLPPGEYTFHLKAMNNDGLWNKKDVTYTFSILPPWYQTWRFRTLSGFLIIGSVVGFFYYRTATLRKRQKQLEQTVLERTAEVVLQKDEAEKQKDIADSQRVISEELREISEQQKHIVEKKQKEIVDSITYAKRIQTALLTSDEYIKSNLPADHFILFKPKDIVSGDFYWALSIARIPGWDLGTNTIKLSNSRIPKNTFYIVTADCTGHGVPGAFMSMLNISFLNENIVDHGIRLPHDVLNAQRKDIIEALNPIGSTEESKDGMDCVLCVYDFDKMLLHFAGANNPLWLVRNGELKEYKADKMPVGKYTESPPSFTLQTIELQKDDIIYTSTDGFADQFGITGKKLMKKKFKEELLKIHTQPMIEQKEYLSRFFKNWKGTLEQVDDVCVIGIRI